MPKNDDTPVKKEVGEKLQAGASLSSKYWLNGVGVNGVSCRRKEEKYRKNSVSVPLIIRLIFNR